MHHELVLIDQSQLRQRQRELHTPHQQSPARLPLELLHGFAQIPAHELRVPIDLLQGARHDVLLGRVDRLGEGLHPIGSRSRRRRRPPCCLHHFVSHPPKEKGIGLAEVLDRVSMQVFVRRDCTMIAAPIQRDVDRVPKGSHFARVPPMLSAYAADSPGAILNHPSGCHELLQSSSTSAWPWSLGSRMTGPRNSVVEKSKEIACASPTQ